MTKDEITPELLQQLLTYDPETGELFWKERPREMFARARTWSMWNTRFAGGRALITEDDRGYRRGAVFGIDFLAHRVAYAIYHNSWPSGQIDHINGVRHDNRIVNLRDVSPAENRKNQKRPSDNTSGVMGVHWYKPHGRWQAQIQSDGEKRHLGFFKDFADAVAARLEAEAELGFHENHGRAA